MNGRRVVITGLGPVSPVGIGAEAFWNALLEGRSGVRRIQGFDPSRFDSQIGGEIDGVKLADYVPKSYRKAGKVMARDIVLAVAASHQATLDADLRTRCLIDRGDVQGEPNLDPARFGANIGAGLICADLGELSEALASAAVDGVFDIRKWGSEGMNNLTPLWLLKFLPNMLACHVTIVHDAQGPSNTITCAEASSHLAIGEACRTIARGVADVCICGGAESKMNPMALMRQSLARRLSRRNDEPERACRPFAADRDGTAAAEGGGLVIVEALEHAQRRGARIYAEIIGFGAAHDAYEPKQPARPSPDGRGLTAALRRALADAGIRPDQVDLIATAAPGLEHDASEAAALRNVFGDKLAEIPAMNVRANLGTNGAGSGALDFIAAILAMRNNTVPPAINSEPLADGLNLKLPTRGPVDAKIDIAVSTAYALSGGQTGAIVVRKWNGA